MSGPRKVRLTPNKPVQKEEADGMTPRGKNIEIVADTRLGLYTVQFMEGGELPDMLKGMFTTVREAKSAINRYLDNYRY